MSASAKARILCAALLLGSGLARSEDSGAATWAQPSAAPEVALAQADLAQMDEAPPAPQEPDSPAQPPPPAPARTPPPPSQAQAPAQGVPPGQWVNTDQYGWVWMPYADSYTYAPPDGYGEPYMYVYYPVYGWTWVVAPWVWGFGPWPHFGVFGPGRFFWFRAGWWQTPGHFHFGPVFRGGFHGGFRGGAPFHGVRPAPFRSGFVGGHPGFAAGRPVVGGHPGFAAGRPVVGGHPGFAAGRAFTARGGGGGGGAHGGGGRGHR